MGNLTFNNCVLNVGFTIHIKHPVFDTSNFSYIHYRTQTSKTTAMLKNTPKDYNSTTDKQSITASTFVTT